MSSILPLILAASSGKSEIPINLILAIILGVGLIVLIVTLTQRYKRCPSNKVLVVYGKTGSGAAKCIHGGASFIWPLFQSYDYLDLDPFVVPIDLTNALSLENIRVTVPTTVTAAISNKSGIMQNAAVRLLGLSSKEIEDQAQDIILGQMRAVIATMKIEEINQDRQAFLIKVNDAVSGELEKIGLSLINVNIRDIDDESGYIVALGRRAAAEVINQANIDVAEQEKTGKTGVAQRQRDQRIAVAAANADAEVGEATAERNKQTGVAEQQRDQRIAIAAANSLAEVGEKTADRDKRMKTADLDATAVIGEKTADRDKRMQTAKLDSTAVETETTNDAKIASYRATQKVAEEEARNRSESASREADGSIRVADEIAQKLAEEARSAREAARLKADVVVPASAEKEKLVIEADAKKEQAIRVAQGEAEAKLAMMVAEGKGVKAILDGKAQGYQAFIDACRTTKEAASLLLIEKLQEIAGIQAQAIKDLPIEKIIVWDSGKDGNGGLKGLGGRLMSVLPPIQDLARQIGLELPEYLGKMAPEDKSRETSNNEE
jgi:flotillin